MYIETSSPRRAGDNAKLELSLCGNGDVACLTFYYHMYGATVGTLTVFSGNTVVFRASGNQGNYWIKAQRSIHLKKIVSCKLTTICYFNTYVTLGLIRENIPLILIPCPTR